MEWVSIGPYDMVDIRFTFLEHLTHTAVWSS